VLGRDVAIKVLSSRISAIPEVRARFEREARAISRLNHSHICTVYDIRRQDETDYLVTEYLEGETLAARLGKGPLPPAEVLRYGIEIAGALDQAHRSGIVHRDLKPGNIMLTKSGAKLMDFGLASVPLCLRHGRADRIADGEPAADCRGRPPRDTPVHGARAVGGEGGRRPGGPLGARLCAV
jgi:serine/threonine protein kinase